MLHHKDHPGILQEAVRHEMIRDKMILFQCCDGVVRCSSLLFRIHSTFISDILSDLTTCDEYSVSLPGVFQSHLTHLINLISRGSSNFSTRKLDNVDRFSDVVCEVLDLAELFKIDMNIDSCKLVTLEESHSTTLETTSEYFEEDHVNISTIKQEHLDIKEEPVDQDLEEGEVPSNSQADEPEPALSVAIVDHDDLNKMNLELEVVIKQEQNDLEEGEVTSKNSPVKKKKNAKVKKKIACQDSGQDFKRRTNLAKHQRDQHGNVYLIPCHQCGETFDKLSEYLKHRHRSQQYHEDQQLALLKKEIKRLRRKALKKNKRSQDYKKKKRDDADMSMNPPELRVTSDSLMTGSINPMFYPQEGSYPYPLFPAQLPVFPEPTPAALPVFGKPLPSKSDKI